MSRDVLIMRVCLVAAAAAFSAPFPASAAETQFPPSGRVVVVANDAKVQIANEDPRPIATATVVDYSRINPPWLWVEDLWGWVRQADVVLLEQAEEHYTQIIKAAKAADQPIGVALHQRGIARLASGQPKKALVDFDAAVKAGYAVANVDVNRGYAIAELGRRDDAIEAFTKAIAKDPNNGLAYDARAVQLTAKDFLEAALSDADRAVELASLQPRVWYNRGFIRQQNGDFADALADYNAVLKLSPRNVEAVANRAYCLKRLGRFKAAADDYKQALEIKPGLAVAQNDYAWLLATCPQSAIRDSKLAIEAAEKAVNLTGRKNGSFLDTLAAAYASAGRWEDAITTAEQAVGELSGADQYAADQRLGLYREKKPFVEPRR